MRSLEFPSRGLRIPPKRMLSSVRYCLSSVGRCGVEWGRGRKGERQVRVPIHRVHQKGRHQLTGLGLGEHDVVEPKVGKVGDAGRLERVVRGLGVPLKVRDERVDRVAPVAEVGQHALDVLGRSLARVAAGVAVPSPPAGKEAKCVARENLWRSRELVVSRCASTESLSCRHEVEVKALSGKLPLELAVVLRPRRGVWCGARWVRFCSTLGHDRFWLNSTAPLHLHVVVWSSKASHTPNAL